MIRRFILSRRFWTQLLLHYAYVCGRFAAWMQFTNIMNWGRKTTENPIEKYTRFWFWIHSSYSTGISFGLSFSISFEWKCVCDVFYFATRYLAMQSIHDDDQKQARKRKKRCWLCNQVHVISPSNFKKKCQKLSTNKYSTSRSTSFPLCIIFMMMWIDFSVLFLFHQPPKCCVQFFLYD